MAVRNTILNGRDWIEGDVLYAEDLNDTFDEIVDWVENGY